MSAKRIYACAHAEPNMRVRTLNQNGRERESICLCVCMIDWLMVRLLARFAEVCKPQRSALEKKHVKDMYPTKRN